MLKTELQKVLFLKRVTRNETKNKMEELKNKLPCIGKIPEDFFDEVSIDIKKEFLFDLIGFYQLSGNHNTITNFHNEISLLNIKPELPIVLYRGLLSNKDYFQPENFNKLDNDIVEITQNHISSWSKDVKFIREDIVLEIEITDINDIVFDYTHPEYLPSASKTYLREKLVILRPGKYLCKSIPPIVRTMKGYIVNPNGPNVVPGKGISISPIEGTYFMRTTYKIEKQTTFKDSQLKGTHQTIDGWKVYRARARNGKKRLYFVSNGDSKPIEDIVYEYQVGWHGD